MILFSAKGPKMPEPNGPFWDKEKIRRLYDSDPVAKALLDALAEPRKNALNTVPEGVLVRETTVDQVVTAAKCERPQAVKALQQFEMLRCGRFVTGRRGLPSRLEWSYSWDPIKLAKEVTGKSGSTGRATAPPPDIKFVEQLIWVRPDVQVSVRFPQDLTQEEAEKVAGVVRNIWLTPGGRKG
jgi:hypothetical protein